MVMSLFKLSSSAMYLTPSIVLTQSLMSCKWSQSGMIYCFVRDLKCYNPVSNWSICRFVSSDSKNLLLMRSRTYFAAKNESKFVTINCTLVSYSELSIESNLRLSDSIP